MTAICIMVLGTTSNAGKSWLATALCRYYSNLGLKVAPFKAQNMSNNARVVEGGEIGSAQYYQALAARAVPEVRMNPLLLKPETDTHSQVVLLGKVDQTLSDMAWHDRSAHVWPRIAAALDALVAENDVVVIEGAGSPTEINLMHSDIVNLRVARHVHARCLLVTDIDRGGAFAHLYGTWALMPEADRALIHGFVLNKFRGDVSLLAPAPKMLQDLTSIPTVATLPMWREHGLPEEDGIFDAGFGDMVSRDTTSRTTIATVAYPRISNLDEFQSLKKIPNTRLLWARTAAELAALSADDWIILPGSKNTLTDLQWLRDRELDAPIIHHARRGGRVLGICGGLQMLGESIIDGVQATGLGLLPLETVFAAEKTVQRREINFGALTGAWQTLSGVTVKGYEIHYGVTKTKKNSGSELIPDLAWQNEAGNVLGIYLHGIFENASILQSLWGIETLSLDVIFNGLADFLSEHSEAGFLSKLTHA